MQSHYEINVSLNGFHFFATAPRSIIDSEKLEKVAKVMKEKFPESEGYKVTATYWQGTGYDVPLNV